MKKVIRLTENDLVRIVKRVIRESEDEVYDENNDLIGHYSYDNDRLDTARFIPNQKGTEKGFSMGANTPERSYKKPRHDRGMGRAELRPEPMRYKRDFDLNENEESYDDIRFKKRLETLIQTMTSLDKIIGLLGGDRMAEKNLEYYKPLGITDLIDLYNYKDWDDKDEFDISDN